MAPYCEWIPMKATLMMDLEDTTRKNGSVPAEFQQNSVDVTSWFGTLDSDNF
jgi:hypothetical protein